MEFLEFEAEFLAQGGVSFAVGVLDLWVLGWVGGWFVGGLCEGRRTRSFCRVWVEEEKVMGLRECGWEEGRTTMPLLRPISSIRVQFTRICKADSRCGGEVGGWVDVRKEEEETEVDA